MALGSVVRPVPLFAGAALLRLGLLFYGIWQDANSALKYTDIDYLVFTDAARLVSQGQSPYDRATYRYTPLLAWMLIPTAAPTSSLLFSFGKIIFALADLLAGWFIWVILRENHGMSVQRAGAFSTIWLWNPMVATISTRGSSEGLLGVLTAGLLWAVGKRNFTTAGLILGLGVHFKIYPFIYAPAIIWWMDEQRLGKKTSSAQGNSSVLGSILRFFSYERIWLAAISFGTFAGLNALMYSMYVFCVCFIIFPLLCSPARSPPASHSVHGSLLYAKN
jgi:GPI mannosyltransferase 1 subunit M